MRKMGFYLQGQGHSNRISVYTIKYDYFYYMFWTADFWGATNLVWQCMFISWNVLWKGCFAVFKVKVTVKVLNFSECLPGQYLWSVKLSMVMHHHQPEYHSEISFCYVTIILTRSSEILKLLRSKLVWWYIIKRQGKTPWKYFLAFTQGVRQRIWLGGLWTRLLPVLAIPISISIPVPIKKMWKEHCFCNEYTCLLSFLVNGSSVWLLHPFVLVMMSIGRFSEAGLLVWLRLVIFRARSRERSQRTSGPISE